MTEIMCYSFHYELGGRKTRECGTTYVQIINDMICLEGSTLQERVDELREQGAKLIGKIQIGEPTVWR